MREIKFRVWDTKTKQFMDKIAPMEQWLDTDEWCDSEDLLQDPYIYPDKVIKAFNGRFVWQQYTGLKGPNNQEIYEGDVLELIPTYENMDLQYDDVKWGDGAWMVHDGYLNEFTGCLIVGNIYESKL